MISQWIQVEIGKAFLTVTVLTLCLLTIHRECTRGGFCNFMHLKPISRELRRELYGRRRKKGYALTVNANHRTNAAFKCSPKYTFLTR